MLSAGRDKNYTGSFKHRVGERILFCHISRQAGARKSVGPHVFPVMYGTRLDPPACKPWLSGKPSTFYVRGLAIIPRKQRHRMAANGS